jgi:hypothetical protein
MSNVPTYAQKTTSQIGSGSVANALQDAQAAEKAALDTWRLNRTDENYQAFITAQTNRIIMAGAVLTKAVAAQPLNIAPFVAKAPAVPVFETLTSPTTPSNKSFSDGYKERKAIREGRAPSLNQAVADKPNKKPTSFFRRWAVPATPVLLLGMIFSDQINNTWDSVFKESHADRIEKKREIWAEKKAALAEKRAQKEHHSLPLDYYVGKGELRTIGKAKPTHAATAPNTTTTQASIFAFSDYKKIITEKLFSSPGQQPKTGLNL